VTQWTYFGNDYAAILDLDEVDGRYQGFFIGQRGVEPVEIAAIQTLDLSKRHKLEIQLVPHQPGNTFPLTQ
jgi:hypothetical protein